MYKYLPLKEEKKTKQAPKKRFRTSPHVSFLSVGIHTNNMEPQKLLSHLKHIKTLRSLTLDLPYLLQIPKHYIRKIFTSLKHIKSLSVLHFELKCLSFEFEPNIHTLCRAILIINRSQNLQVNFSLKTSRLTINEHSRLSPLLESFIQLERFTSVDLTFLLYTNIVPIIDIIGILRASKSLTKISLTFKKCKICYIIRLHELFLTLKEIIPLKNLEILFEECEVPPYEALKTLIPFVEEVGQNVNVKLTFNNYQHFMTRNERSLFTKSFQEIKSPGHKIQVRLIQKITIFQKFKSLLREYWVPCRGRETPCDIHECVFILVCPWIILCVFAMICMLVCLFQGATDCHPFYTEKVRSS